MRELELAIHPSIDPAPGRAPRVSFPLSRQAFVVSIVVHVLAGYALSRHVWLDSSPPPRPSADFFLFEMPVPPPRESAPETPPAEPVPEAREEPAPAPAPRPAQPAPEPTVVVEPPPAIEPAAATEPVPAPAPRAFIDFDEERRRAANQVIGSREAENEYLTFSIDDVAPPRPEEEPEPKRSIFEPGPSSGGSVATVGQQRTKVGRKLVGLCNALTGGFSVFGLFSACAAPDSEPSGLFPEVRPAYLDLMPECVDTRDTAPALALEAPYSTVKCRLVKQEDVGKEP